MGAPVSDPVVEHEAELTFMDTVLDGWGNWSNEGRPGPQREQQAYVLLSIRTIIEGTYYLRLSHDDFLFVEQRLVILPDRYVSIIKLEYLNLWRGEQRGKLKQEDKWRMSGLKRTAYGDRLDAAKAMLYGFLLPQIAYWQLRLFRKM